MLERFTDDARTVVFHAHGHARRLGHRYIGCEHLLLALVGTDQPASAVLREQGLTPGRVEEEIVRRAGIGAGAGLFADLDRDALASIGIDLDAVRARIDASFGADALTRADQAVHRRCRRSGPARGRLIRRWRHRDRVRRVLPVRAVAPPPGGRYAAADQPAGPIPFTPGAKKCLQNALREAVAQHQTGIGVEHIALGLLVTSRGLVPPILDEAGLSAPALRAAILDRYRPAS
jgi:ATP-dependent Clp protease ATP-binding subunit ClpA